MTAFADQSSILSDLPNEVAAIDSTLELRPPNDQDLVFAENLYVSDLTDDSLHREQELRANLRKMLDAQQVLIIWRQDERQGWLQLAENTVIRLRQIHLVGSARGQRIGSTIMTCIMQSAARLSRTIELSVMFGNSAVDFYHKLGFVECGSAEDRVHMCWSNPQE